MRMYGSVIYGSAGESNLKIMDPIHHQGIHICLDSFRTTSVQSLFAEAGDHSLSLHHQKLLLSCVCLSKANPGNPAYFVVFGPQFVLPCMQFVPRRKQLSFRVVPHLQAAGVDTQQVQLLPPGLFLFRRLLLILQVIKI